MGPTSTDDRSLTTEQTLARHWSLDRRYVFLNHGSFGACPSAVLEHQSELRTQMERRPTHFFAKELGPRMSTARERVAQFVGADPAGLVPVANASTGVNTVLASLDLGPGDEVLVTNHEYTPSRNALDHVAARAGASVVVVDFPLSVGSDDALTASIVDAVTPRTALLLVDHVTSQTGLVMPLARIVEAMNERGVDTLVDGAHAPGMLPLDLEALGAAYYTGNCHKWLCSPKGAAFLYVRADRRERIRPLVMGHAGPRPGEDPDRFQAEFAWQGTHDPTAWLCVPVVIDHLGSLVPGGWDGIYRRNHQLAVEGRQLLADALGVDLPCPDAMIGSMASLPLPVGEMREGPSPFHPDPIQVALWDRHRIEAPVITWPRQPGRLLRVSAHLYNSRSDFLALAAALPGLMACR